MEKKHILLHIIIVGYGNDDDDEDLEIFNEDEGMYPFRAPLYGNTGDRAKTFRKTGIY